MGRIPKLERILKELNQSKDIQENKETQDLAIIEEKYQNFSEQLNEDNAIFKSISSTSNNMDDLQIYEKMSNSFLKNKVFQLYNKKIVDSNFQYQNANIFDIDDVPIKCSWALYSELMLSHVEQLAEYMIELPGFNSFDLSDFSCLINEHLYEFFCIKNSLFLINKEFQEIKNDQTQFIKKWILKFFGSEHCDSIFKFKQLFCKLKLTHQEISFFIPVLLLSTGK